jgi:hypothetical protein
LEVVADRDERCEQDRQAGRVRIAGATRERLVEVEHVAVADITSGAYGRPRIERYDPRVHALEPGKDHERAEQDRTHRERCEHTRADRGIACCRSSRRNRLTLHDVNSAETR